MAKWTIGWKKESTSGDLAKGYNIGVLTIGFVSLLTSATMFLLNRIVVQKQPDTTTYSEEES